MGELRALPAPEPSESVVARLEQLLEAAREGKIRSLAIVALGTERSVWTLIAGENNPYVLLGGLEDIKHDVLTKLIERS